MHGTTQRTELTKQKIISSVTERFGEVYDESDKLSIQTLTPQNDLSLEFVNGLIDGDGSFGISFAIEKKNITPFFSVSGDSIDFDLLSQLCLFFDTGTITKDPIRKYAQYRVQSRKSIVANVVPLLQEMHFNTVKSETISPVIEA